MSGIWGGAFGCYLSCLVVDFSCYVSSVISRLVLIFPLPWVFMVGFELSGLCFYRLFFMGLWPLCLLVTVWTCRQPLACVGAVLSLLDGPTGCAPAFCVVWFRFRLLRKSLALWPVDVRRVYRLLEMVGEGAPSHGPIHLLSASAAEIGFRWDSDALAWSRPGLPLLSNLVGPIQHFKAALLDAWRNKVAADLCGRKDFRGGPLLDIHGSLQLLNSSHVRERYKALLRGVMVGGVWNGFLLHKVKGQRVPCRFCGAPDGDGHLFWECSFLPLVEIRDNLEFHDPMREDTAHWPRCLLWHGLASRAVWC